MQLPIVRRVANLAGTHLFFATFAPKKRCVDVNAKATGEFGLNQAAAKQSFAMTRCGIHLEQIAIYRVM